MARKTKPKLVTEWRKPAEWSHIPGEPTRPPIVPTWAKAMVVDGSPAPAVPLMGYQTAYLAATSRFTAWLKSRQIGGSWTTSLKHVLRILHAEEKGRSHRVIVLSAGKEAAQENIRYCAMHARAYELFRDAELQIEEGEEVYDADPDKAKYATFSIKFPGSGHSQITAIAANPYTAVGRSAAIGCDEVSRWRDASDVWDAVVPMVTRGNLPIDLCSTPKGTGNLWERICRDPAHYRINLLTTNIWDALQDIEVVRHLLPEAVAEQLRINVAELYAVCGDDAVWAQNYLCQFLDLLSVLLTLDQISACEATGTLWASLQAGRAGSPGRTLFGGWDVARKKDLSVAWIFELVGDVLVTRWIEVMLGVSFPSQQLVIDSLITLPGMRRFLVDQTGMGLPLKEFAEHRHGSIRVGGVTFTGPSRVELSKHLKGRFVDKKIRLPGDPLIRDDFRLVKKEDTLSSERIVVEESGESHADRFWAAALGVYAAYEFYAGGVRVPTTAPVAVSPQEIPEESKRPNVHLARRLIRRVA